MLKIIINSLLILFFYIISLLLSKAGFPYLTYILGIIIFFLPGFFLALALEQQTDKQLGQAKLFLWTFLFSIFITPTFIYLYSSLKHNFGDTKITYIAFSILLFLSFAIVAGTYFWKKIEPTTIDLIKVKKHKILWYALGIFSLVMLISFVVYPYIPEADPYTYLIKIREIFQTHLMPDNESRPLFLSFSYTVSLLSKISAYWIYKLIIPLFSSVIVLIGYLIAIRITKNKLSIILSSLIFLSFPVVTLEILIPRPQSIFLITLPVILFLLSDLLEKKLAKNIYFLFILLFVTVIGAKYHPFFFFDTLLVATAIIVYTWPLLIKKPLNYLLLCLLIFMAVYPWIKNFGLVDIFLILIKTFLSGLSHPSFRLWFINNYTNIDGSQMGWPGLSSLFYYGYNLGLFSVLAIFLVILKIKNVKVNCKKNWVYLYCFLFFFLIAEILPRLGLSYLPDRAWLFVSLTLAIIFIPATISIFNGINRRVALILCIVFVVSVTLSPITTWAKQGWTTKAEYKAAMFIKNSTPDNSSIISQGGNLPMVEYFTGRKLIVPDNEFFMDSSAPIDTEAILQKEYRLLDNINSREVRLQEKVQNEIDLLFSNYPTPFNLSTNYSNMKTYLAIKKDQKKLLDDIEIIKKSPKYVLYSNDKFTGLYGIRDWWKKYNLYNAHLEKFNNPTLSLIYNQDNIMIWKYEIK